mmetsp:Transcript_31294/g.46438  ORF Transcript_31294/g.46438 Transcript_31294/m.46438 type:complete len:158 (-) Transcript_31294:201-674(-)
MCTNIGSFIDLDEASLSSADSEHEPLRSDFDLNEFEDLDVHPGDEHWMIQLGHFFVDPMGWFMEVTTPKPTDPREFMKQIGGAPSCSDDESTLVSVSEDSGPYVRDDVSEDEYAVPEIIKKTDDRVVTNEDFEQFVLERMSHRSFAPDLLPHTTAEA